MVSLISEAVSLVESHAFSAVSLVASQTSSALSSIDSIASSALSLIPSNVFFNLSKKLVSFSSGI